MEQLGVQQGQGQPALPAEPAELQPAEDMQPAVDTQPTELQPTEAQQPTEAMETGSQPHNPTAHK